MMNIVSCKPSWFRNRTQVKSFRAAEDFANSDGRQVVAENAAVPEWFIMVCIPGGYFDVIRLSQEWAGRLDAGSVETIKEDRWRRIKVKKELFDELLQSVKQGGAIMKRTMKPARTFTFAESEVKKIREQYGLSQDKFAILMGISTATLRNWEQGRRKPEGSARVLLQVAEKHPDALLDLASNRKSKK
jgi:putative transcriptional regulator